MLHELLPGTKYTGELPISPPDIANAYWHFKEMHWFDNMLILFCNTTQWLPPRNLLLLRSFLTINMKFWMQRQNAVCSSCDIILVYIYALLLKSKNVRWEPWGITAQPLRSQWKIYGRFFFSVFFMLFVLNFAKIEE